MFPLLDRKPAIDAASPDGEAPDSSSVKGEIEFRGVKFTCVCGLAESLSSKDCSGTVCPSLSTQCPPLSPHAQGILFGTHSLIDCLACSYPNRPDVPIYRDFSLVIHAGQV